MQRYVLSLGPPAASLAKDRKSDWLEARARAFMPMCLRETLVEMLARHLKTLRVVHTRAVEALRDRRFDSAMEGVRALDIAVKLERLIAGEASTRADLVVRELRRREADDLLVEDADPLDLEAGFGTDEHESDGIGDGEAL